ncbi:hypothetical protein BRYFOR_08929 [Marvinbryantia formatexigens DSM 14469]|uniref:Uncharacterized protein n=1 Tax=Marvinbryantia formatexigens DSM 14469 TaxID=478749 RepID=C6LJU2_9FIRM|nr:hypothetical protein BRYFOR_08929 [Marvinbryantia formatexigens DSM 14469]
MWKMQCCKKVMRLYRNIRAAGRYDEYLPAAQFLNLLKRSGKR